MYNYSKYHARIFHVTHWRLKNTDNWHCAICARNLKIWKIARGKTAFEFSFPSFAFLSHSLFCFALRWYIFLVFSSNKRIKLSSSSPCEVSELSQENGTGDNGTRSDQHSDNNYYQNSRPGSSGENLNLKKYVFTQPGCIQINRRSNHHERQKQKLPVMVSLLSVDHQFRCRIQCDLQVRKELTMKYASGRLLP